MKVKIINNKEDFRSLQLEWESLQKRAEEITTYNTFSFLYNWWESYDSNRENELFVICIYENTKLIGIAPLMIETRKLLYVSYQVVRFIGKADFLNFIIDNDAKIQSVIKKVFDVVLEKKDWHRLELTHISQYTSLSNFLLKSDIYNNHLEFLGENPIIDLTFYHDFSLYKKQFFKKNISYYRNKLSKDFETKLDVIYGNKLNVLSQISEIHIDRNSESVKRRSLFEDIKIYNLLLKLYENETQTITFLLKTQEGMIIAYATCYVFNKVVHNWNTSFNLKFRDYSPGDLIYFEMINYLFENRTSFEKLDLGAGRYPWKFRMTDTFIATYKFNYNLKNSKKYYMLSFYDKLFKMGKILFLKN